MLVALVLAFLYLGSRRETGDESSAFFDDQARIARELVIPQGARLLGSSEIRATPLSREVVCEFETKEGWVEFRSAVRERLSDGFRFVGEGEAFMDFARHLPADDLFVHLERLSEKPLRVRFVFRASAS